MSKYENIGLLFNKHYFKELSFTKKSKNDESKLKERNEILIKSSLQIEDIQKFTNGDLSKFVLTTTYPGLFTGSGYSHESSVEGEFKLGFYFDYTSGMPSIPGSSVKGVLHSVFPCKSDEAEIKKSKKEYLQDILSGIDPKLKELGISELEKNIFDNEKASIYKKDIFFDAFPISQKEKFLGNDYITPHKEALKNPIPLQFLKVMPQVEFQFNFKLNEAKIGEIEISAQQKEDFFKQILLDFGIGAKTNVGYGQLEESKAQKLEREKQKEVKEKQIKERKAKKEKLEKKQRSEDFAKKEKLIKADKHIEALEKGIDDLLMLQNMEKLISKISSWANNYYPQGYKNCLKDENLKGKLIPEKYQNEFIEFIENLYNIEIQNKRKVKEWKKEIKYNKNYKLLKICIGEKANKWF